MAQHVTNGHERIGEASDDDESRPFLPGTAASASASRTRCSWPWLYLVALLILIAVVSDIGESLYLAPRIRILESVICQRHYAHTPDQLAGGGDQSIPEHLCKVNAVQDQLASLVGWQFFFDSIPAIVFPIPFGYLADKYGRKWILFTALAGYTLSYAWTELVVGAFHLPVQYTWLSSGFFLLGGGPTTGTTLLTTMVADVVPPELRGTVFFYRFCTDLIADLFVPPLTALLMSKNLWIPLVGAVLFQGLSALMILIVPETLSMATPEEATADPTETSPLDDADSTTGLDKQRTRLARWRHRIYLTSHSFSFVTHDATVGALVFMFLISKVGRQCTNILLQYVSKRYEWSLAQAGLLSSLRAAVNLVLFTAVLPAIANFTLTELSATKRDLLIARASIVLLALGGLGIFISASSVVMIIGVIILTFGSGFAPVLRSIVTSLVESRNTDDVNDIGRLYAVISTMEGIGSLIAAPGMAWALRLGMSLGPEWTGLPFGFAALLFALVSVFVFRVKVE
ncbi:major facilitator superfamily domain-containing protein [Xylariomycetidae sp. FL2044]|nr:major facilitator superfamily domain-containing protein [Xylariomycetidae sp. FL2044]